MAGASLLLFVSCAGHKPTPKVVSPEERVLRIADAVVDDRFEQYPERPTMLRVPGTRYDRLPDDSIAAERARRERRDQQRRELDGVEAKLLQGPPLLAYQLAQARLADSEALDVCRNELWSVNQMSGWQVRFSDLAQAQPVGTADLRAQAVARFGAVPGYADTQIVVLREGLGLGYSAAQVNVTQVIGQLDQLLALPVEESPFYNPATRDDDPEFRLRFAALVREQINPAIGRYRAFLRDEYLPRARAAVSVSANPNGAACYRASLRYATTLPLEPEEVHAEGLAQIAAFDGEMSALSRQSFGGVGVPQLLQRFKTDPKYLYRDADDMRRRAQVAIIRATGALPTAFGLGPTQLVQIEPISPFQERTAAPHYLPAALDGSRPAVYRIRLYQADKQSWVIGESTAYHEVVPGHHLQINIATNRVGLPRIARFLSNSGFSEGWALYAEREADEMGLYSGPAERFGMLSNFQWRAVRMVVDTGLHAKGWSRQQAIDLLLQHTALSAEQASAEVDRYIAWPGQAPSYMVGYLEIQQLRQQAQAQLGDRFSIRFFHDAVLENGNVPLTVLKQRLDAWVAAQGQ